MAFHHNPNVSISGASDLERSRLFLFTLKTLLKAHGWVAKGSGTGNTGAFDNSGVDLWVTAASVVGQGAWIRLRHSITGTEAILAMRNTAGTEEDLGFLWSRQAGFGGGAPSATVPPTATDQVLVADRAVSDCTIPTANFKAQFICDDASPSFIAYASTAGPVFRLLCMFDWARNAVAGDTSPGAAWWISGSPLELGVKLVDGAFGGGYDSDDLSILEPSAGNGMSITTFVVGTQDFFQNAPTTNPRDGNATYVSPLICVAQGALVVGPHVKGTSRLLKMVSSSHALNAVLSSKRYWVIGNTDTKFLVPGDGTSTPTV